MSQYIVKHLVKGEVMFKILVIGFGGREHAIAKKFLESEKVEKVYVAKGNAGMKRDGIILVDIAEDDHASLIQFAKEKQISWTFVGPEVPLLNGIVDDFTAVGLKIFGPTKAAAMIEGSKNFAKEIMDKYDVPTASYKTFSDFSKAKAYVEIKGAPIVIKADGLAAGKGVVVAFTVEEAILALSNMLEGNQFGESGSCVVVEEFLEGEEFSLLSFVKGEKIYPMVIAQDHKRAYDNDKGPNTGGMGTYSPVLQISQKIVDEALEKIIKPVASGMGKDGTPFTGILYAGLIATKEGPKVIEFNARFGDPETQVVLPRLTSDLAQIIDDLLYDKEPVVTWHKDGVTLGVVVAAEGYPREYKKGMLVPAEFKNSEVTPYYAGVACNENGELIANGGRVFLLCATADNVKTAQKKIYDELDQQTLDGFFYRKDIGYKAD
ncbi:MAG: phosphoribosylamine--glycine ligase [Streptococcaceae bacterium]|jgi:phosphoribosylamine--glycine ligase|nr:phosphoribosylamine--glycine ligase [Streptococcaceae bacterium]